jgi:branched-chain amino acid transport system substrate-binding protein
MSDWAEKGNDGMPSVALIHHDSPFGQSPVDDAAAFAEANGVAFMSIAMPKATDFVAELAQMQQFGANYVIVHTVSSPAAVLVKDAVSQGLTDEMQFINMNWCADEGFIELAGEAAEGVVGTLPFAPPSVPVDGHKDADAWLKENGSSLEEASLHYTQGWWTMALMAKGIETVINNGDELTGENIRAALEGLSNFDTGDVTSPISFSASSHRGNNALRLYQVEGGSWNAISDLISAE